MRHRSPKRPTPAIMPNMEVTMKYDTVNAQWPDVIPALTGAEAMAAAKRLYRIAMGKPLRLPMKLTSGRRYTWPRQGVLHVNPDGHHFGGWRDLVHDISHWCHRRLYPKARPHDPRHAFLEKTLISEVVKRGWLDGKLKRPERPKPSLQEIRYRRIVKRLTAWEAKLRRAETAVKKLRRQRAYYERARMEPAE
jgi:hypothetical protein